MSGSTSCTTNKKKYNGKKKKTLQKRKCFLCKRIDITAVIKPRAQWAPTSILKYKFIYLMKLKEYGQQKSINVISFLLFCLHLQAFTIKSNFVIVLLLA